MFNKMASSDVFFMPLEIIEKSAGFSLDIGGTLAKIAYVPNEVPAEIVEVPDGMGMVKMTSFPSNEAGSIVQFLKTNCKINRNVSDDVIDVEVTGIGVNLMRRKLCDGLNIRLDNQAEFDLSLRTLNLMQQLNPSTAFYPECTDSVTEAHKITDGLMKFYKQAIDEMQSKLGAQSDFIPQPDESGAQRDDVIQNTEGDDVYPFMMVLIGSGAIMTKMSGPNDSDVLDITTRAGRYFYGLGSLLTGCKSFSELIDLAEKGTNKTVDMFTEDFKPERDSDHEGYYTVIPDGLIGTSFGKTCGKSADEFKKEDLARALLVTTCLDIAQIVHHMARRYGINKVYFGGMFIEFDIIRQELTKHMVMRDTDKDILLGKYKKLEFNFMNFGGYIGAIGGMIPRTVQ